MLSFVFTRPDCRKTLIHWIKIYHVLLLCNKLSRFTAGELSIAVAKSMQNNFNVTKHIIKLRVNAVLVYLSRHTMTRADHEL